MTVTTRTRHALGLMLAATLALTACGGSGDDGQAADESPSQDASQDAGEGGTDGGEEGGEDGQEPPAAPEADLSGIPDVVAEVNGEEVTKDEFVGVYQAQFQQAAMQAQMSGEEPDEEALRKQVADDLVDTELLSQEAANRDIEVTDEDVDSHLAELAEQNQLGSAEELLAALEQQGTSEDQAREQVRTQVLIEQLVADEAGPVEPTEQELRTIYDQAKEQQAGQQGGQQLPPFKEVRDQIEQQARSEEETKVARALAEELREDADITINL